MGRAGSKADGGGAVEEPGQVPIDEPPEGVGHVAPVGAQLAHAGAPPRRSGLEEGFDGRGQDRHRRRRRGVRQGGVQGGALRRPERAPEGGFGQGAEQPGAPLGDLGPPGGVVDLCRARAPRRAG